jgi:putative ABC transport system permease protein
MSFFHKLKHLLPSHRRAMENDMAEELAALEAIAQSEGSRGELGSLVNAAEEARSVWSWTWLEQLRADVRYALRTMRHSPGFTAIALLSLALGIGANTAIFSLMNAILLKSLPVSHPESLVVLSSFSRNGRVGDFGYRDYQVLRDGGRTFSGLLAASSLTATSVGLGVETKPAQRKIVSSSYFAVLGVQPAVGRVFLDDDENLPVAVISDRFWRESFAASSAVIGKQIDLDGQAFSIVGVAPPGFVGETVGESTDIWATVSLMPAEQRSAPGYTWLNLMGRLKPGVAPQQASAELALLLTQIPDSTAQGGFVDRIAVEPGGRGGAGLRDGLSLPLRILMGVVAVVLLIACANLASLLLARAATRQREIATRLALGAGRGRVVRQLMTESMLLALLGGALGLLFAVWSERLLLNLIAGVGRTVTVDLHPDFHVLGFTAIISVAAGLFFGLAPAMQAVRRGAGVALNLSSRALAGRGRRWGLKDGLIAMQVALSLLLLIVGTLLIRTIRNLKSQDVGFHAANVLSVQIAAEHGYQPAWSNVITEVLRRSQAIPGVQAASVSFMPTLSNEENGVTGLKFEGLPATTEKQRARANWIGPRYFETSGIPLIEGREFSAADNATSQKVAMINQAMVRRYFAGRHAVGQRFEFNEQQYQIVGLVKDAKHNDLRQTAPRFVYFAALQSNSEVHSLEVRATGSPLGLAGAVRDAVREADPRLRIGEITTLEQRIDQKLAREFLVADLAGFFSGLTLLLVAIGVYGTLAYTVARRTSEIGLRMALGARAVDVLGMVLRDTLVVLAAGLAAGVVAALVVGQALGSIVFGLKPTDPSTIMLAVLVLCSVAVVAGYVPARRASRVDPASSLRLE